MSSGMVPLELSKDNNQYCKISVFMPNAGSINESVISVTNVGGDSFSVAVSMIRWNANKVFCKLINGTKISNINMYYTVDTERFCFYIKANWYAKIIVSRLGLVNTSKIESINAIPSGAIEVPISWRDKRYSTELGELIGTATGNKSGLMSVEDKKRLGRRFFKGYTKLVESKYWYNHYVALIFGASPASNLGSLIAIDWKGNELISVTRFFGNNDNVKLYLGSNPETNMYELWLGLIGLDGDGSEFIIQSRESIDLDSKTVETLPSYLKVISISWQKNNDFSELGELLGNPKGTKSFSSWSEFTDFVNEMPIKTIQPFVSNFNAFAGEGFYGNVVQGLVIKQLEDAVFIFGIAIDGTLIFRKRNYPDVSTWEDPKIIIHSNNWHKIYFVTDLGELLPLSTNTNKGLTRRTAYFDLIQGKLYKIAYKEELYVYKPVICLLYVLRNGISSCYVASLSGYRNGVSHFKLICGNDIQFKLYQKLNSANYFDFMLECPDNSAGIMEIKAMIDLTVIETTEPLSDWQQIATK